MALNFPTSPTLNDTFSSGGITWVWNGSSWTTNRVETTFDSLSDVTLTGAANNDLLYRSGGAWIDTAGLLTWDGSTFLATAGTIAGASVVALSNTLEAQGSFPFLQLNQTDGGTNEKKWNWIYEGTALEMRAVNDASNAYSLALAITRTGYAIGALNFGNATDNPSYSFLGTGSLSVAGQVRAAAGSVGAPAYSFTGDTNTGLYNNTAGEIYIVSDGTARLTVNSSGATVNGSLSASSVVATSSVMEIQGSFPFLQLNQTDGGTNEKRWVWIADGTAMELRAVNDASDAYTNAFTFTRSAQNVSNLTFGNATSNPTYTFAGTGGITTTGDLLVAHSSGARDLNVIAAYENTAEIGLFEDTVSPTYATTSGFSFRYAGSGNTFSFLRYNASGTPDTLFTANRSSNVIDFKATPTVNSTAVSLAGHVHSAADITSGTLDDARLSSNIPLKNVSNTFTVSQRISNQLPWVGLDESDQTTDERWWLFIASGKTMSLRAYDDALSSSAIILSATRGTGTAITSVTFGNATNNPTYTFAGTGTATFGGRIAAPAGTAAAPSIYFGDTGTGFYRATTADTISVAINGSQRVLFDTSGITMGSGKFFGPGGSAAAPTYSFLSDNNSGMYSNNSGTVYLVSDGTARLYVDSTGANVVGTLEADAITINSNPVLFKREASGTATNQWVRIAKRESQGGRGTSIVRVYTTGGSHTPYLLELFWDVDWTATTNSLDIRHNSSPYITSVKSTKNSTTAAYLEIYVSGSSISLNVEVQEVGYGVASAASFETSFTAYTDDVVISNTHLKEFSRANNAISISSSGTLEFASINLAQSSTSLRITSASGYGNFGSENSGWFHMSTDRAAFYVAQPFHVNGNIVVYNTNNYLDSTGVVQQGVRIAGGYRGPFSNSTYSDTTYNTYGAGYEGLWQVQGAGDSRGLQVFNVAGSLGPVQIEYRYQGLIRWRNQTDASTWQAWRTLVDDVSTQTITGFKTFSSTVNSGGGIFTLGGTIRVDGGYIYGNGGTEAIRCASGDTWLRLNQGGGYTSGVYTPGNIRLDGVLYLGASYYLRAHSTASYSPIEFVGSKNSYGGFYDNYSAVNMMWDSSGNGGEYRQTNSTWRTYWNTSNSSMGLGASTTSASYKLYVTGAIYATGDVVAFSDERKKENIVTVDNALEKINKLRGVYYNKIGEEKRSVGVIAQEVEKILPEVVTHSMVSDDSGEEHDEYGVDYGKMVGLLIEAVKELSAEVKMLKETR